MTKILFVGHSPDFYGADKVLYQVIEAAMIHYEVHVILPGEGEMAHRLRALENVELHFLPLPRFSLDPKDIIANLATFVPFMMAYHKLLKELRPGLIYGNTIRCALPVAIARRWGYETLMHYHECNVAGLTGWVLARLAERSAKRNVFVCRAAMNSYSSLASSLNENSTVIHNGIEPVFKKERELPDEFKGRSPRFLCIAQLAPHKRIDDLLEAMARIRQDFPEALLVVLGEGAQRPSIEERRAKLGLAEHILLPGYVNDINPLLCACDIFLAPFEKEACNMAVIEAMAAGKPVVAAAGGGMPEIVLDDETGFLYPPGDVDQMIEKTLLLANSPELQDRLGHAGHQRIVENFNQPVQMGRILDIIEDGLSSHGGQG